MNKIFSFCCVMMVLGCVFACSAPVQQEESIPEKKEDFRSMLTKDVNTLISDSGITQYRIVTPQWEIYDKSSTPRWYFPKGILVEKFDSVFEVAASIKADTAYFFSDRKLWRLVNNVEIHNVEGDIFETEELFWDQRKKRIHSDKFIHIERAESVIEGYGFDSNESMTQYVIRTPSGIFPIGQDSIAGSSPTSGPDSTSKLILKDTLSIAPKTQE